jgi:hypothetical protein
MRIEEIKADPCYIILNEIGKGYDIKNKMRNTITSITNNDLELLTTEAFFNLTCQNSYPTGKSSDLKIQEHRKNKFSELIERYKIYLATKLWPRRYTKQNPRLNQKQII